MRFSESIGTEAAILFLIAPSIFGVIQLPKFATQNTVDPQCLIHVLKDSE